MEDGVGNTLLTFAFETRIFLILLQVLANIFIPDHDAKVFNPPMDREGFSSLDHFVELLLGGLKRWDAIYFVHISEHGYTYENCAAFFPLFSIIVAFFARCISVCGLLHLHTSVILVAVSMNCLLFVFTAKNLYILGVRIGLGRRISFLSSILFCINPASIFMTVPYSEILYLYLLVLSLRFLQENKIYFASFFIGLSALTRSNGLLGTGFVVHYLVRSFLSSLDISIASQAKNLRWLQLIRCTFQTLLKILTSLLICIIPFLLYQYYIFLKFCSSDLAESSIPEKIFLYGRKMNLKLAGDSPSPWCTNTFPLSYSYIQSHYWGVGFLSYYELKQIPNFLLAAPVVFCGVMCCTYFFKLKQGLFYGLGLVDISRWYQKQDYHEKSKLSPEKEKLLPEIVVYIFHLAFLVTFGCLFVHIQVLTRMLFSSSPVLYWYCALVLGAEKSISMFAEECVEVSASSQSNASQTSVLKDNSVTEDTSFPKSLRQACIYGRRFLHPKTDNFHSKCSNSLGFKFLLCICKHWASLRIASRAIVLYFIAYFIIGTVMFSNFLPWT